MQVPPVVQPPPQMPPPQKSNTLRNIFLGCGCLVLLMIVMTVGAGWWLAAYGPGLLADAGAQALNQAIAESSLPADQKARLTARITQLQQDVKSGKIGFEQAGKIVTSIAESPILPAGTVYFIDEKYFKPSGLDEGEQELGKRAIQRVTRGMIEKKISESELKSVLAPISEPKPNRPDETQLKDKVTDDELRDFINRANALADLKQIDDEPYEINIADEFDKAIDKAMEDSK